MTGSLWATLRTALRTSSGRTGALLLLGLGLLATAGPWFLPDPTAKVAREVLGVGAVSSSGIVALLIVASATAATIAKGRYRLIQL